jgi:hypothetical protein
MSYPLLGAFLTMMWLFIWILRKMHERDAHQAQAQDEAFRAYVRQAAREDTSSADDLTKLADLRDRGVISEAEFQRGKEKLLGQPAA